MVVLLVEPDHDVVASRALLLSRSGYMVATASSQRAVFHLRWMSGIYLVILSDTLGLPGLRSAAGYVRALWPGARIVVLGVAPSTLEAHLYDEVVDHRVQPKNLLDRVTRLSEALRNQGPMAISYDRGASPWPHNGWLTAHRSKLPENSPARVPQSWEKNNPQKYSFDQTVRDTAAQRYGARQDKSVLHGRISLFKTGTFWIGSKECD
jgi:hypothetical protein